MNKEMLTGNPTRLILRFMLPLLLGSIFQELYSVVDTLVVGRGLDMQALAAVGSTGSVSFLIFGFTSGLTSGFSVITAQRYGANDDRGVRRSVATIVYLTGFFAILVTIISLVSIRGLLELMKTPYDIIDDAHIYISVVFSGTIALMTYNQLASLIRALGDSRTPLIFLIIASFINIVLDIVFVIFTPMGVAGAALATVIAQGCSGVLCFFYARRRFPILRVRKEDWKFDWKFALEHLRVAVPMAFQFSITAIGVMTIQAALNDLGSTAVAAYTAAKRMDTFASMPMSAFGVTMATFVAQNYGAGQFARIREGVRKCSLLALWFSLGGVALVYVAGKPLVQLFISGEDPAIVAEAVSQGDLYLKIVSIFYILLGLLYIYRNALQGMGRSFVPMMAGFCELVMRVITAATLAIPFGYIGICLASPIAWIGAVVPLAITYFITIYRISKKAKASEEEPQLAEV